MFNDLKGPTEDPSLGNREESLQNISQLMSHIQSFSQLDLPERENILGELINRIKVLKPTFEDLNSLDSSSSKIKSILDNLTTDLLEERYGILKEPVKFFEGTFTLVVLDINGRIIYINEEKSSELYKLYGNNLIPYALSKALIELHLNLSNRNSGISNDDNYEYIQNILGNMPVFYGSTAIEVEGKKYFIGGSGCEINLQLLEESVPQKRREKYFNFGGLGDQIFVNLIEQCIKGLRENIDLKKEIKTILNVDFNHPLLFRELRDLVINLRKAS